MDLPPPSAKITGIASRLSLLPAELVDPVISQLPLRRILELACASTAGPVLLWSIEHSPRWSWLFRDRLPQLQRIWTSFNRLSWLWCRRSLLQVPGLIPSGLGGGESTRSRGPTAGADFLKLLEQDFLDSFIQLLPTKNFVPLGHFKFRRVNGFSNTHFEAVCSFLPPQRGTITNDPRVLLLHKWTVQEAQNFLPALAHAHQLLNEAKAAELNTLAELYDNFPAVLKMPLAPQTPAPRKNTRHILDALRYDANSILTKPVRSIRRIEGPSDPMRPRHEFYRFRYPHPALIPNNPCLKLFKLVVEKNPLPGADESSIYPHDLLPDLRRALEGLMLIYRHDKGADQPRCIDQPGIPIRHVLYAWSNEALPSPQAELDWLRSFARCAQWMMTELPDMARSCQVPRLLLEPEDYQNYIATESTNVIADQLVSDESLSEHGTAGRLPTLLALYMPPCSSYLGREVARFFLPDVDTSIQLLLYEETVKNIKRGLGKQPPGLPRHSDDHVLASDTGMPAGTTDETADEATGVDSGRRTVDTQWNAPVQKYVASQRPRGKESPVCYICRLYNPTPHKTFTSMCQPCGEFNVSGSSLSLPRNLDLRGKVALVTGARVNLGYHTALRLLRCGAKVIASTRYPRDAVSRYSSEPDFPVWKNNLKVVGADFRVARDAFDLAAQVRTIVTTWRYKLDILINNAAQTLTDSVRKEEKAIERELFLQGRDVENPNQRGVIVGHGYRPRVRGGLTNQNRELGGSGDGKTAGWPARLGTSETDDSSIHSSSDELLPRPEASSWVQSLSDIPYEDVISAHSINTFVPLILIRELMPLMRRTSIGVSTKEKLAAGYVVNVSSREGIFEASTTSGAKGGKHVHTNMSKAGLNMITETEASTAWKNWAVAMNTVDPGYMSAAPEWEDAHGGERPIGWEDGAGRVLWPVAIGELARGRVDGGSRGRGHVQTVWGRFLKHYGAVRVDVRQGRG